MSDSAPKVVAVILAGGEGQRLGGVIKANIEIGGVRLLRRVADVFGGCEHPVLVAHGRIDPALLALPDGLQPVPDLVSDYRGPLAGLAGAVRWLMAEHKSPDFVVTAAVDTPFLPWDFVDRAIARLVEAQADAVIARCAGQDYPTNALWRFSSVNTLADRLMKGAAPHSLKRLGLELGAVYLDWPSDPASDPFANLNTPDDLRELQARAATILGGQ